MFEVHEFLFEALYLIDRCCVEHRAIFHKSSTVQTPSTNTHLLSGSSKLARDDLLTNDSSCDATVLSPRSLSDRMRTTNANSFELLPSQFAHRSA